jgi:Predicted solute binding protein
VCDLEDVIAGKLVTRTSTVTTETVVTETTVSETTGTVTTGTVTTGTVTTVTELCNGKADDLNCDPSLVHLCPTHPEYASSCPLLCGTCVSTLSTVTATTVTGTTGTSGTGTPPPPLGCATDS